jgi:hypothetical protein
MKNKILIIAIIVVIVFCVPIILLKKASNSALSLARQIPMNLAREYAWKLGGKIDGYIEALQSLSNEMSFYENLSLETRRREYEKTMQSVFEKTPEFIQMFTIWKPNAIDGMDARYIGRVGSTYTGQFAYALTRDTGQITHMTSTVVNETIIQITGPNGSVIAVSDPAPFKNMGLDTYAVRITVPIINKRLNEIVGAVGCQLDISMIQPLLETAIKENVEIAAMSVYANTGLIIACYMPYRIGKNMLDAEVQFGSYLNDSFEAVKNSKEYLCFSYDPVFKANMQIAIANVSIGGSPTTWSVMIDSIEDYIMRDVKTMTKIIVLLAVIAVVVVLIVIVLLFKRAKAEKELKEKTERETREKTQAEAMTKFVNVNNGNGINMETGILAFPNGVVYAGQQVNGKPNGSGLLTLANGTQFAGNFVDGILQGKVKIYFTDGGTYEGDFVNGKQHGKGKSTYPDGTVYEGDWVNDKPHGKGKYTFPEGDVYEGDFINGEQHGKGKMIFTNGKVYEGDFVDGETKKGKMTFPDGKVYEGDWVNNKPHGKGKMIYPDGKVEEGNWKDGEFVG